VVTGWPSAIQGLVRHGFEAGSLDSIDALLHARVPDATLASWVQRCAAGRLRIFAVRHVGSERWRFVFSLRYNARTGIWVMRIESGLRGLPSEGVSELIMEVQIAYQEAMQDKPHDPVGNPSDVARVLAEMDLEDADQELEEKRTGFVIHLPDGDVEAIRH
jgi:hypothetical protein